MMGVAGKAGKAGNPAARPMTGEPVGGTGSGTGNVIGKLVNVVGGEDAFSKSCEREIIQRGGKKIYISTRSVTVNGTSLRVRVRDKETAVNASKCEMKGYWRAGMQECKDMAQER